MSDSGVLPRIDPNLVLVSNTRNVLIKLQTGADARFRPSPPFRLGRICGMFRLHQHSAVRCPLSALRAAAAVARVAYPPWPVKMSSGCYGEGRAKQLAFFARFSMIK